MKKTKHSTEIEVALKQAQQFLKMAIQYTEMTPLLDAFVFEIKTITSCEAVGVRILNDAGNIPYLSYIGFSKDFYEKENLLSIHCDNCMCVKVIKGDTDPDLPYFTNNGSFYPSPMK